MDEATMAMRSRIRGCLLGGALGDALGGPVEFMTRAEILRAFGRSGITDLAEASGRPAAVTDDTQMTLFTAEGLLRAFVRDSVKGICDVPSVVSHAYLRWLLTQDLEAPRVQAVGKDGWLWSVPELHARRAPGNTCVSALAGLTRFTNERARNNSKGAGAIMRVAPVGLVVGRGTADRSDHVFELAQRISWITHGHPSGYLASAAFAVIIHALVHGRSLNEGIARAKALVAPADGSGETLAAIDRALSLAARAIPPEGALAALGEGWVAEEALGMAIYCAIVAPDFVTGVRIAVNHDGDSDTTGSLVGQLLGVRDGEHALPGAWLRALELRDTIAAVADDLAGFQEWDPEAEAIWERYPGW
jgi:ADP-ribosylglycohydrolase